MRRLFADYPRDRLWALTSRQSVRNLSQYNPIPAMERQVAVPEVRVYRRGIDQLAKLVNHLLIPWTVWRGVKLVRKEKIEGIFTIPWGHFTIAAYLIHRITRLPIHMYVMDDPAGTRRALGHQPIMYSLFMPRLVRACRRVWGVSNGMCEYFEKTYGPKCLLLLPLLDLQNFQYKSSGSARRTDGKFHVVFTGSIYSAQLDAVRRLVRVLEKDINHEGDWGKAMRLTLYTSVPAETLERLGLMGKNVRRDEVKHDDISKAMAGADTAFLPLSFDPNMRHVVETSFPSKIAEYLAAGVPILAHAPPYSTVARYCREYDCGLLVDEPNDASLRSALLRLATDAGLREGLSAKSLEAARKNHDASRIVPMFLEQVCQYNDNPQPL
jgi:glycosyltransferase involved in cell wall biosynthesis